ncbi:partial Immunity protein SdpI, partial [Anaerolineae bacterium]
YHVLLLFRDFTMGFLLMMFIMNLIAVHDGRLSTTAMGIGLGILFMLIGNYLPKTPRNWFFGIRSPWTMSSDEVWRRSHIFGGWWFVGAGLLIAVLSVAGVSTQYLLPAILVPTVIVTAFVYPYLLFRRLQRSGHTEGSAHADDVK